MSNVLELALDALTTILPMAKGYAALNVVGSNDQYCADAESAIAALRDAIKAQGEPVGYFVNVNNAPLKPNYQQVTDDCASDSDVVALYTSATPHKEQ